MVRLLFMAAGAILLFVAIPPLLQEWMARNGYADGDRTSSAMAERDKATKSRSGGAGRVTLKMAANGHYFAQAYMNNKPIRVVIDTGATAVALKHEDAKKLGIRLTPSDFRVPVRTANGIVNTAEVTLREVRIGTVRERNIRALVAPKGAQSISLLGMAYLSKLKRFEMRKGKLTLEN